MRTELIQTADGSHTLFVPELDEHYHSTHGAMQEANHIFIEAGLRVKAKLESLHIFEVGFGTGLNAYLSLKEAEKTGQKIEYTSIELHPVAIDIAERLNYATSGKDKNDFLALHNAEWNELTKINNSFSIDKIHADLLNFDFSQIKNIDLVYFDTFAPEKQAEIWHKSIFQKIYESMTRDAIIVTYCAKGIVRRRLQAVGFVIERLAGPPGKREILRGRK